RARRPQPRDARAPGRRVRLAGLTALAAAALLLAAPGARGAEPTFDTWWHDGRAELDGYRLTVERYGHPRTGRAVAIYVTEPFSRSQHVKLDAPARAGSD